MSANPAIQNNDLDLNLLSEIDLFKGANMLSLSSILDQTPIFNLPKGEHLIESGQPVSAFYLLISGKLGIYPEGNDLNAEPTILLESGCSIGERLLVSGKVSEETVSAEEDCSLMSLDEASLTNVVNGSHVIALNFLSQLIRSIKVDEALPDLDDGGEVKANTPGNSNLDEITGLHNWEWMENMLDRQVMRSATDQQPLSLMMFDIDQFMTFQGDFGEDAANLALHTIAQLLTDNVRPTDLYARYQEDKFLVVLPDTDMEGATTLAKRIQEVIQETQIAIPGECLLPPLTASCGLVQMTAFVSAGKLLEDVEAAMKRAKETEERLSE